jgi:hypothetical protein
VAPDYDDWKRHAREALARWNADEEARKFREFAKEAWGKIEAEAVEEMHQAAREQFAKVQKSIYSWFDSDAEKKRKSQALEQLSAEVHQAHEQARRDAVSHINVVSTISTQPASGNVILTRNPSAYQDHVSSKLAIKPGTAFRQLQQSARDGSMDKALKEKLR